MIVHLWNNNLGASTTDSAQELLGVTGAVTFVSIEQFTAVCKRDDETTKINAINATNAISGKWSLSADNVGTIDGVWLCLDPI